MENGKVKHTIKSRAILKKIETFRSKKEDTILKISDTITVPVRLLWEDKNSNDYIKVQIEDILNQFYASFVKPITMTAIIILPEQTEEICLRFLMDCFVQVAEEHKIGISNVEAECSPDVLSALFVLTIFGEKIPTDLFGAKAFFPGQELVMIGTTAAEGTIMLEIAGREALKQRFSRRFLEDVRDLSSKVSVRNKMELVQDLKETGIYCIGRTGVFGAFWEISSITGKGFSVELDDIPICQETIEICEFFDVNPYMLRSGGALLVAVRQGRTLVDRCRACGIEAAVIGNMTDNLDKLIHNKEEYRHITMPTAVRLGQNQPEGLHWIY